MSNPLSETPDIVTHDRPASHRTNDVAFDVPDKPVTPHTNVPDAPTKIPDAPIPPPAAPPHNYFDNANGYPQYNGPNLVSLVVVVVVAAITMLVGLVIVANMESGSSESITIAPTMTPTVSDIASSVSDAFSLLALALFVLAAMAIIGVVTSLLGS